MCYHRDDLEVYDRVFQGEVTVHITPNRADSGILIGSNDRVINAIKQVAILAGRFFGLSAQIELHQGTTGHRVSRPHIFERNPNPDIDDYVRLADKWLKYVFNRTVDTAEHVGESGDLVIRAKLNGRDEGKEITAITALAALNDVLYAIGQREGVIVKLKPLKERLVT